MKVANWNYFALVPFDCNIATFIGYLPTNSVDFGYYIFKGCELFLFKLGGKLGMCDGRNRWNSQVLEPPKINK